MDDAVGPATAVFNAVRSFGESVERIELQLQLAKCLCYSPRTQLDTHPARPDVLLLGDVLLENGDRAAGIKVGGIPIGDPQYINVFLNKKAADVLSTVNKIHTKLRDRLLQSLHTLTYYSFNSMFHHWLQHCYPPAEVQRAAQLVDDRIQQTAATYIGPDLLSDDITQRRFQLACLEIDCARRSLSLQQLS